MCIRDSETGVQKEESPRGIGFMTMAEGYKLGVADRAKIEAVSYTHLTLPTSDLV